MLLTLGDGPLLVSLLRSDCSLPYGLLAVSGLDSLGVYLGNHTGSLLQLVWSVIFAFGHWILHWALTLACGATSVARRSVLYMFRAVVHSYDTQTLMTHSGICSL